MTGLGSAAYTYDPFGRRMTKTSGGMTTKYVRSREQVIAEYDGSDQLLRRYIYGIRVDRPILMTTAGLNYYYHYDEGGSVVALSNGTGGIAEVYTYSPFGQSSSTTVVGNPIRFSGRELDPETGFYYFRKRYYDPGLGRFLEPDPIGYEDSANLYGYVRNNPLNWRDQFGLSTFEIVISSFAPFKEFGFGFLVVEGDGADVALSADIPATARIEARFKVDPSLGIGVSLGEESSPTACANALCSTVFFQKPVDTGIPGMTLQQVPGLVVADVFGSMPLTEQYGIKSPDINLQLTLEYDLHGTVTGATLLGDGFPSARVYQIDNLGNTTLLIDFPTTFGPIEGPMLQLWGIGEEPMGVYP